MKLDEQNRQIVSNVDNTHEFTIQNNAKMFQILSDKIYTYKIAAIVREISCNAYDSHIEAGIPDVPFKVVLPNSLHDYFEVEDYGVGLDEDQVYDIYTMYGASTKSNSNDLIGAFGLGSKTPFAYTSSFTIETRKNGIEYLFNAYIGNSGAPSISLLRKRETTEGNGVRIKVPVKSHQRDLFKKECEFILSLFPVRPIVTGDDNFQFNLDIDKVKSINDNNPEVFDTYCVKSELYRYKKLYAVMGNVAYGVNLSDIVDGLSKENVTYLEKVVLEGTYSSLFVKFDIGELDVSASRESLSIEDGKKTQLNLITKFEDHVARLREYDLEQFNKCTHPLEALQYVEDKYKGISGFLDGLFKYKNKTLGKLKQLRIRSPYNESYIITKPPAYYYHSRNKTTEQNNILLSDFIHYDYIILTKKEENTKGLDKYRRSVSKENPNVFIIYIPNLTDHKVKRYSTLVGKKPSNILHLEDLKEADKKERVKRKYTSTLPRKKETEISAVSYKVTSSQYHRKNFSRIKVDEIPSYTDVVYYELNDDYFEMNLGGTYKDTIYISTLSTLCKLTGRELLIIVENSRNIKSIKENNIEHFKDYYNRIVEEYKDIISTFKTMSRCSFMYSNSFNELIINNPLVEAAIRYGSDIISDEILNVYNECKDVYNKYSEIINVNIRLFENISTCNTIDLIDLTDTIKTRYPMLKHFSKGSYSSIYKSEVNDIIDYMILVDSQTDNQQVKKIA